MKGRYFIDKQSCIRKFTQQAEAYNSQFYQAKSKGQRKVLWKGSALLKKAHFDVYEIVLYLLIRKNNPQELTDLADCVAVTTSRQEILNLYSQRLSDTDPFRPINPSLETIWRHIKRLEEAEILRKTRIKGMNLFRLHVNPKALEICDMELKKSVFSGTSSKTATSPEMIAKSKLYESNTKEEKEKSNTKVVDKAVSGQKPDGFKKTTNETKTENTREVVENPGPARAESETFFNQQEKISKMAVEETDRYKRTNFQVQRYKYAAVFETYKYLLSMVFTDTKVPFESYGQILNHPFSFSLNLPKLNLFAEHNTALNTLLAYFAGAKTYQEIDRVRISLNKSIELGRRNILRNKLNIDFLTPSKYLKRGKISLVNVLEKWLPNYIERQAIRVRKLKTDQQNRDQVMMRSRFDIEADLLLQEVQNGYSALDAIRYIETVYKAEVYKSYFVEQLDLLGIGNYKFTVKKRNKAQEELLDKIFNTEVYMELNQEALLKQLNSFMKDKIYTNHLASALEFKDPMMRANPTGVRNAEIFNDFVYRRLLFN